MFRFCVLAESPWMVQDEYLCRKALTEMIVQVHSSKHPKELDVSLKNNMILHVQTQNMPWFHF